ncbi:ATP-binding cassette domain-containing protein [Lachnoanaerobaculum orale]|uniref:ATP-binding cassette domain-containing protein n=1 Tax=Lachnoanaerobaculum orale TaxID=979627 RepID=UPI0023A8C413|nr:ABC transporter ATP-binding protein [Lachnoanaerobaculum orale]
MGQRLAIDLDYKLENDFLVKCGTLPLKDFENENTYELLMKANELGKVKILDIFFNFLQLIECILSMVSVSAVLINIDGFLWSLITIVPIISALVSIKAGKYIYEKEKKNVIYQRKSDYLNYLLTNNIAIKEIISFNISDYLIREYKRYKRIIKNTNYKIINLQVIKSVFITALEIVAKISFIIVTVMKTIKNGGMIGDVMGFIYSLDIIESKISIILSSISEIYKSKLYVDNYYDFIDKETNNNDEIVKTSEINIKNITIKNLGFSYNTDNVKELKNINIEMGVNNIIAVVGANGAGKSTLIKILSGLYDDYTGEIFVNDVDLSKIDKKIYRERITVIFQDFNKYELSLRENVAFSNVREINNDQKIDKVMCDVGLSNLIDSLDKGIDSQMGNWFGGRELSKGQWQRIALARVLFRDADMVILDEPTSALDPMMEREIFDMINEISKDKILILVTHRVENLKKYNPLYVFMEKGEIVEQGFFENIKDKDVYKKMMGIK